MKQHTLAATYSFSGTGLHTGRKVNMTVCPAPADHGIIFERVDASNARVEAHISNFEKASRSTFLKKGKVKIRTTEHLLSALSGLGVDNALVQLDSAELPILDGSAMSYVTAFTVDGLVEQDAERKFIRVEHRFEFVDENSGSRIVVEPSEKPSFEVTIDFNSKVLGVQSACFDEGVDYVSQIAPCRTFCFLREVKPLLALGLIKGGSLDNALVIDEPKGYYNNPTLRFENECARHKLLDIIGDFALAGHPIAGRIIAYKPGHSINTNAVKALISQINEK